MKLLLLIVVSATLLATGMTFDHTAHRGWPRLWRELLSVLSIAAGFLFASLSIVIAKG